MVKYTKKKKRNQELYDMSIHYGMLRDYNRMICYVYYILKNGWLKDKVCCDLGAGTGILSLFALKAGIKHIYIIENQINMIKIIENLLDRHNIEKNRYTIYQGWSTDIKLPVKVDCIIHELIGIWGNGEQCLSHVVDFRDRNLKRDGKIIPDKVEVNLTLQYTNRYYDPMYGSYPEFLKEYNIDISCLIDKKSEYDYYLNYYRNRMISITDNNYNYIEDTSECNIETIIYDLQNESKESIDTKIKEIYFKPRSNIIVSLLSTIRYYYSEMPKIIGDSGKYNTNWKKQLILFDPRVIKKGEVISGYVKLGNEKDSETEQRMCINLELNGKTILKENILLISENNWIVDYDPVGIYKVESSLKEIINKYKENY